MKNLQTLPDHPTFKRTVAFAIILCSILLGIETFYADHLLVFQGLDFLFTLFFIVEIIIRIAADRHGFFHLFSFIKNDNSRFHIHVHERGFWNWFDFSIVVASILSVFAHLFPHPEFLEVARLFRVLRVMRLLEISKELIAVERKIVSIIPTIFSFALLLGVLLFIYSIIGIFLFSHHKFQHADFTSLGPAFLTLFQLMTLDGWSEMMYAASAHYENSWLIKSYFVSFVVLTAIVSFNVFVAVLTSQVHEKVIEDQKGNKKDFIHLEKELSQTEDDIRSDFKEVLSEVKLLRKEVEEFRRSITNKNS
jgi:voltage-gated sodium channel